MAQFHDLADSIAPGSRLSFPTADAQNAMLEAGRWVRSHREHIDRIVAPKGFEHSLSLWGRNDTGQTLALYNVVKLDNVLFDKTTNSNEFLFRPSISLKMPDIDEPSGIVAAPGNSGAIMEVRTIGVSPVQVDVTNTGHEFARAITNDPAKLKSNTSGEYEILWKESGTGVKWALVRFPPPGSVGPAGPAGQPVLASGSWTGSTSVGTGISTLVSLANGSYFGGDLSFSGNIGTAQATIRMLAVAVVVASVDVGSNTTGSMLYYWSKNLVSAEKRGWRSGIKINDNISLRTVNGEADIAIVDLSLGVNDTMRLQANTNTTGVSATVTETYSFLLRVAV